METFDAGWLALREPVDHRSRAESLLEPIRRAWRAGAWRRVVDLGSGTGSNLRYLAPRLPAGQRWVLVDHDPDHLSRLERLAVPDAVERVTVAPGDLAGAGLAALGEADLVTASALLDLVSREWLARMVDGCVRGGRGAYFALSYDGEIHWTPSRAGEPGIAVDPDDELVRASVNAHQTGDKGVGPALGPAAARTAERLFQEAGYLTRLLPSPWALDAAERPLARRLVDGWAAAAVEVRPDDADRIGDWARHRRATLAGGRFSLTVGHLDLLALPPGLA